MTDTDNAEATKVPTFYGQQYWGIEIEWADPPDDVVRTFITYAEQNIRRLEAEIERLRGM